MCFPPCSAASALFTLAFGRSWRNHLSRSPLTDALGGTDRTLASPRRPRLCSRRTPSPSSRRRDALGRRSGPLRCRRHRGRGGVPYSCPQLLILSVGRAPGCLQHLRGHLFLCDHILLLL